jgi:hypothetical protein
MSGTAHVALERPASFLSRFALIDHLHGPVFKPSPSDRLHPLHHHRDPQERKRI